jgi:hypothetical protein
MRYFTLLALMVTVARIAIAQTEISVEPNRPVFTPLIADPRETRIAYLLHTADDAFSLDIGTTFDLVQLELKSVEKPATLFGFGADAGVASRLRRASSFKFPVETADYLFGVNWSVKTPITPTTFFSARLRLSHISAHFVDGHFDTDTQFWRNGIEPFVYSREFFNLVCAVGTHYGRAYLGYEFNFNLLPVRNRHAFQSGLEGFYPVWKNLFLYAAVDFRIEPIYRPAQRESNGFGGRTTVQAGLKFNAFGKRGFRLMYSYQDGLDFRGMYLGGYSKITTLGLMIDF